MIAFKRIQIKNFRRYKYVEINPPEDNGLFVFIGKNFLGKSTFLNAICWCLYDIEPFTESIEKKLHNEHTLLNEDAKRENQFDEVRVELEIQHDEKMYLFVRTWRPTQASQFKVMLRKGQDWTLLPNPTVICDALLPRDLREYFIFAGEDAESLFSPGYETKLKNGVWKVSNIEVLDRLIDHLGVVYTEVQRELSRMGSDQSVRIAIERKVELEKESNEKKERLVHIQDQTKKQTEVRNEYSEKIKQSAVHTEKIRRRELLEGRRVDINSSLQLIERTTNNMLTERTPFLFLGDILRSIHDQLTADEATGTLPPSIRADFVNELLSNKKCICGRAISTKDGSDPCLRSLLVTIEPSDRRAPLLEDRYPIKRFLSDIPAFARTLDNQRSEKAKLLHEREQLERELKNISEELSGASEDEISGLEEGIKRIERDLNAFIREDAEIAARLRQIDEEVKEIDDQIRKEAAQQNTSRLLSRRLQVLEDAKDAASYVRERITDQVRKVLSANTEQYFKELFWEQTEYESIEFTEDYKLIIKKRGFAEPSTVLSSGERKVLGIAALRAIADLSGFSGVPIFFDAPLTKLGSDVEENVLKMLPRLAPNKQVFIFSLDSEKMVAFARTLGNGRLFGLSKDPHEQNSTIITALNI